MKHIMLLVLAASLLAFGCVGQPSAPQGGVAAATHLACEAGACVAVSGAGTNGCSVDADCAAAQPQNQTPGGAAAPQTHLACVNNKCTQVQGAGANSCASDSDCVQAPAGSPSQVECSTLSPDCGSCVAKAGCGWCKTSNSCFAGTASGPSSSQCTPSDWSVSQSECAGSTGGASCSAQPNCASCLSGAGCKFCIQGSVCTDASNQVSCLGGWLNQSYQCNYASR